MSRSLKVADRSPTNPANLRPSPAASLNHKITRLIQNGQVDGNDLDQARALADSGLSRDQAVRLFVTFLRGHDFQDVEAQWDWELSSEGREFWDRSDYYLDLLLLKDQADAAGDALKRAQEECDQ